MLKKNHLLFITILIEGYVVLATELLAIRLLVPFVGSGTETIAITISCVLLPLAIGYHYGGRSFQTAYAKHKNKKKGLVQKNPPTIRRILLKNILNALVILGFGLNFPFLEIFFSLLNATGIKGVVSQSLIYGLIFLVYPVFLLAQTVPLVSNFFSQQRLSQITGRMLFFSTLGSFLGSIVSTLILMNIIGVHYTAIFTLTLLSLLVPLLVRKWYEFDLILAGMVIIASVAALEKYNAVSNVVLDNQYSTVQVVERKDERWFLINRSLSSIVTPDIDKQFKYTRYVQDHFISPAKKQKRKLNILVLGAGGFTLGLGDEENDYTFVDINPALKETAEKHLLKENLAKNRKFVPFSARAFLEQDNNQYDLIVIDTYTHVISVPMETVTREFLQAVKDHLKQGGAVVVNMIATADFRDKFSVRYDNTFASVFPSFSRQIIDDYDPWLKDEDANMGASLYIYFNRPLLDDQNIYTDDRNTYSIDR